MIDNSVNNFSTMRTIFVKKSAAYIGASGHLWPPIGPQKTIETIDKIMSVPIEKV